MIVTVQNGIPWWYFQKLGGKYDGQRLQSLDPDRVLEKHIDSNQPPSVLVIISSSFCEIQTADG